MNMVQSFSGKELLLGISLCIAVITVNHGFYFDTFAVLICFLSVLVGFRARLSQLYFIFGALVFCTLLMGFLKAPDVSFYGTTPFTILYFTLFSTLVLMGGLLRDDFLSVVLKTVILFLLFVHLIQLFVYVVVGTYLDFSYMFSGKESRYGAIFLDWPRLSSMYEEPSTYASIIVLLGVFYYILTERRMLSSFCFFAAMSTFSFLGMFLGAAALVLINFNKYISSISIVLMLWLIFEFQALIPFGTYFIRMNLLEHLLELSGPLSLFGTGFFGANVHLMELTDPKLLDDRIASLNDLGSLIFVYTKFGLLGVIAHLYFIFKFFKRKHVPLVLLMTLGKLSILHPLFLILFSKNYARS